MSITYIWTNFLKLFLLLCIITKTNATFSSFSSNLEENELILQLLQTNHYDSVSMVTFYACQYTTKDLTLMAKHLSLNNIFLLTLKHFDGYFFEYKVIEYNLLVVDVSCEFTQELIDKANKFQMFATPYRWLILDNTNNASIIEEIFKNIDILVDSDVTVTNLLNITKIFKRKTNLPIVYEQFGLFTAKIFEENSKFVQITAVRRRNLQNITLNNCNVVTHNETFQHLLDKRIKHIDTITKVNYVFMLHLSDMLNVTMNFSFVDTWGYLGNNSLWTGMIGELTRNHAEIGGTPLFFTSDRVRIIDYIAMTTPTKSKFVFRQPKLSYITNVYTLPFNTGVWIASMISVVITAMGLYIGVKWEWYKRLKYVAYKNVSNTDELHDDPIEVAFVAFAAVCQQGASAIPYSVTGRIVTIIMYTSLMFLYTSYSANIVALLQSSSTSIQTLEDLLKSRLQVGVDDTVFNHFYFPNASEPVRRAIYLQKVAPPGQTQKYFPIEEGVRRVREGLFAFHMETGAGYKIVGETFLEDEKCGLQEIQFLQVPDPFLAVQKNTSFKEIIKIGLRKLHESGIQNREVSILYTKRPICMSRGSSFMGVAIVDCYPAALVFVVGIAIAFGIFALELFTYQFASTFALLGLKTTIPSFQKQIPN